jgi:hypothetical protein
MTRWQLLGVSTIGLVAGTAFAEEVQYGEASAGASTNLATRRALYPFALKPGKAPSDIVGVAIGSFKCDKVAPLTWVFYKDGTFTNGPTNRPDGGGTYRLPPGKTTADVIDMAAKGLSLYTWYKNGEASVGELGEGDDTCSSGVATSPWINREIDLAKKRGPYPFTSKLPKEDIVGIAIDDSNSKVFTYFKGNKVTTGTTDQLGQAGPFDVKLPPGKSASQILGIGIDGTNSWVFGFYAK